MLEISIQYSQIRFVAFRFYYFLSSCLLFFKFLLLQTYFSLSLTESKGEFLVKLQRSHRDAITSKKDKSEIFSTDAAAAASTTPTLATTPTTTKPSSPPSSSPTDVAIDGSSIGDSSGDQVIAGNWKFTSTKPNELVIRNIEGQQVHSSVRQFIF